jgi:hypothetical protein
VRLTAREKLQTLVLASAVGLQADRMAEFTEQDNEKLRQFQSAYDANRTIWFRGKRMPSVIFELVALTDGPGPASSGKTQTSICVRGLRSEEDIKKFHEVMSQSVIRRRYSGLRLSYDRALVRRPAREVNEDYDYLQGDSMGETLCGTRLVTRGLQNGEVRQWESTIGGILVVQGGLYAMTSSHPPDPDEEEEAASGTASLADGSSPSTLVEANYDYDVEPALILDFPVLTKPAPRGKDAADPPSYFWPTLSTSGPTLDQPDQDWRLIRLEPGQSLPNSMLRPSEHSSTPKTTYLRPPVEAHPSRRHVSILAGFSGLCGGTLLPTPAFVSIHGAAPTEVWTILLDNNMALQKGDSGSWAVDDEGCWLGIVTAMSGGDAYIIPAHRQFGNIEASLSGRHVYFATPLRCYLQLAGDQSLSDDSRYEFAAKALTRDALIASSGIVDKAMDQVALALASATTQFPAYATYEHGLKLLLRSLGNNLAEALSHRLSREATSRPEDFAFSMLKEAYDSIVAEGRRGWPVELERQLRIPEPADDGISIRPVEQPAVDPVEPSKEKPSNEPLPTRYHGFRKSPPPPLSFHPRQTHR